MQGGKCCQRCALCFLCCHRASLLLSRISSSFSTFHSPYNSDIRKMSSSGLHMTKPGGDASGRKSATCASSKPLLFELLLVEIIED